MNSADWFTISNIDEVDSPSLVVFPDRVKKNIEILKSMLSDLPRLRPHVKTHKSTDVAKLLLQSGFTQFKCATIAEAEMLAETHAPDVLLAYQPVGPKAERLAELIKQFPKTTFSCLVDNDETANQLNNIFKKINYRLHVYIDLNIGMNRTGIKPGANAVALYKKCQSLEGIISVGLHAYDGHLRDADLEVRIKKCDEGFIPVIEMQQNLVREGFKEPIVVVGGTTTFPIHAKRKNVVCSPGTFIYWDHGYHDTFKEQPFEFAALVMTRVISKPSEDLICIDLGHKSIASENSLDKRVFFLNASNLTPTGHSEEHMVLKVNGENNYQVGDVLYGVPFHICPTVALYDSAVIIKDHKAADRWTMLARNRKIKI
ncbi:MAG TPA: D-TA family PLP-dependent enzyme [Cyclobacteriaceae bacterium]|jgi:D-serine deaminase-like pyridoxal phosphate-dependent protein|nr:D-TA family PLP-dependent enzyme [Cyclobacteriaceae bacterium]